MIEYPGFSFPQTIHGARITTSVIDVFLKIIEVPASSIP